MTEDFNTDTEEILNEEKKRITMRVNINEIDAADILAQLNVPFPPLTDLDEIHLVITKENFLSVPD